MGIGWQELIALSIVVLVVGFALYRRFRRPRGSAPSCCEHGGRARPEEQKIHFYRRSND